MNILKITLIISAILILGFIILSMSLFGFFSRNKLGDITIPVAHGTTYEFNYTVKKSGRLSLFLVPFLNNKPSHTNNDIYKSCKEEASLVTTPDQTILPSNKKLEKELNEDLYNNKGELTTWGKMSLNGTRNRVEIHCLDGYYYAYTQFIITNQSGKVLLNLNASDGIGLQHDFEIKIRRVRPVVQGEVLKITVHGTEKTLSVKRDKKRYELHVREYTDSMPIIPH